MNSTLTLQDLTNILTDGNFTLFDSYKIVSFQSNIKVISNVGYLFLSESYDNNDLLFHKQGGLISQPKEYFYGDLTIFVTTDLQTNTTADIEIPNVGYIHGLLEKKNINYPYNVSEVTPINRDVVNYNSTGNSDNTINNINNEKIIKLHGLFTQVGMLSSNNSLFFTGYKLTV